MKSTTYNSHPGISILLGLGAVYLLPYVQAANAVCKSGWAWSYNSKGQNPCEVAASLQGPCLGQPQFELGPLDPGNHYVNPKKKTPLRKRCGCNTVIFSLYMACTLCQNSTSTQTWTGWSQSCDNVYVARYPFDIPQTASVPHWAYLDYTEGKFNYTLAEVAGRDPEATPPATSSTTNPPPTVTEPPDEGNDQEGDSGGSTTNVGAIAGGIVGGIVGLVAVATLAFFFLRRRMRRTEQAHVVDLDLATGAQWETTATQHAHKPQRLYDPSDPSTFPAPVSVTGEDYTPLHGYTAPTHHGKYTGSAEI